MEKKQAFLSIMTLKQFAINHIWTCKTDPFLTFNTNYANQKMTAYFMPKQALFRKNIRIYSLICKISIKNKSINKPNIKKSIN